MSGLGNLVAEQNGLVLPVHRARCWRQRADDPVGRIGDGEMADVGAPHAGQSAIEEASSGSETTVSVMMLSIRRSIAPPPHEPMRGAGHVRSRFQTGSAVASLTMTTPRCSASIRRAASRTVVWGERNAGVRITWREPVAVEEGSRRCQRFPVAAIDPGFPGRTDVASYHPSRAWRSRMGLGVGVSPGFTQGVNALGREQGSKRTKISAVARASSGRVTVTNGHAERRRQVVRGCSRGSSLSAA